MLKLPCLHELERRIASLPFDVLIRRIHSSSLHNPSRSLEAHFCGTATPLCVPLTRSGNFDEPLHQTDRTVSSASSRDLREILSQRLLKDVQRPREQLRLDLDDLSLIVANAVRHTLSPSLITQSLEAFLAALSDAKASSDPSRQVEAIARVMESSCEGFTGNCTVSWDNIATLVAVVEERWVLLCKSTPLVSLMIQFLAAILDSKLQVEDVKMSMGKLTTDPVLLKGRCLYLIDVAVEFLSEAFSEDSLVPWSSAELRGMCTVVVQLRQFEVHKASSVGSSRRMKYFWKWTAANESAPVVYLKVSQLVTNYVLAFDRPAYKFQAMTLQQVADLFCGVCGACGTAAVERFGIPVQNVLKFTVAGDPMSMLHVIRIGEASLQVEGATAVLMEVVQCISRYGFVLTAGLLWDLWPRACRILENAPFSTQMSVKRCAETLQSSLESTSNLPNRRSPDYSPFRLGVSMLAILLIHHDVPVRNKLEEIVESMVEKPLSTSSHSLSKEKKAVGTSIRFLYFLVSVNHTRRLSNGKKTRALRLALMDVEKSMEEEVMEPLSGAERTLLRLALEKIKSKKNTQLDGLCIPEKVEEVQPSNHTNIKGSQHTEIERNRLKTEYSKK